MAGCLLLVPWVGAPAFSAPAMDPLPVLALPPRPAVIPGPDELDPSTNLHMTGKPQFLRADTYRLKVDGKVLHPLRLTYDELRATSGALVGGLTLCNVRRGVTQSCTLGYWIGAKHSRQGYMTAAVRAVVPFVFDSLELHRLEAACLPTNAASIKLLEKTGFQREGLARRYLRINGLWQDHLLYALLDTDMRR